jgi:nicotinamidase-related amidase
MSKTALIVIDLQNDYFEGGKFPLHQTDVAAANAARLLDAARRKGDLVVHVQHISAEADAPFFAPGTVGAEIHATVAPKEGELKIIKQQINAFLGTDLKNRLDEAGVDAVTIAGAMSHMCVDAATRAASDFGYSVTVVHDATATRDLEFNGEITPAEKVQTAMMSALAFGYAQVVSTDAYLVA